MSNTITIEESILDTTKQKLGIDPLYTDFDRDIIDAINFALNNLYQLGVGTIAVEISDRNNTWSEITTANNLQYIKTYVYLKARLVFDPPQSATLLDNIKAQISELESRINYEVDY